MQVKVIISEVDCLPMTADPRIGILTDEHNECSDNQPVVLYDDHVYTFRDMDKAGLRVWSIDGEHDYQADVMLRRWKGQED